MLGFFKVLGNKIVSVELQLPQSMKIHNVFHLNPLQKTSTDPLTNQINEPWLLFIINNEKKWKIEAIPDVKSY